MWRRQSVRLVGHREYLGSNVRLPKHDDAGERYELRAIAYKGYCPPPQQAVPEGRPYR